MSLGVQRSVDDLEPPRAATRLLEHCIRGSPGTALVGDLIEEFKTCSVPTMGVARARRWYWIQVIRSLWPALTFHVHLGSAGRLVVSVLIGVGTLFVLGDLAMAAAVAGFGTVLPVDTPGPLTDLAYLVGMLPASVLGGYAAAWHGGRNGIVAALALAAVTGLPMLAAIFLDSWSPSSWSHAVWFFVGPLGIVWGAMRYMERHPVD